jgi:hypothetical protein
MGGVSSFPAESDVAGRLMLSGADALGHNPWNVPRPSLATHGLGTADLDDYAIAKARHANDFELRQVTARVISAYLVPLAAFAAAYYWIEGPTLTLEPRFEWVAYLGASLILGVIGARLQTLQHLAAKRTCEELDSVHDRRFALRDDQRAWFEEQRKRTTTQFWLEEIPQIAREKGVPASAVFAQEVGKLFVAWNWQVRLNQRADDYGVDIFTSGKEGSAVVQCKHGPDGPSTHDIRDLAGSRHAFGSDYGLMVSVHPPTASRQNEFYSEKGQLECWHLGHILEQCIALYRQRTGEDAPEDPTRTAFLNADGTPLAWQTPERVAAE